MANKIVIITIPGIGTKGPDYSEKFEDDVIKFSKKTVLEGNLEFVRTRPFYDVGIDKHQEALFKRLKKGNKLGGVLSFRKVALEALGDAVAFEHKANDLKSTYLKIHQNLKEKIIEANNYPNAKIVCVAASLGVHLLSTYIWDVDNGNGIFYENKDDDAKKSKYNLRNLKYLATIGCNIPLFVSGLPQNKIKAFDKRNAEFIWENFYDPDDILGWPLQDLCPEYDKLVKDFVINTGQYVGSHMRYWKDNDFTNPFTQKLIQLL